jgi:hypothetical protein
VEGIQIRAAALYGSRGEWEMPPQTIDTKFGAVGEGDILFVEDWGYTPELWVVEKISPAGLYGFRMQCAVITPDTFESRALGTRDVLQATLEKHDLVTVTILKRGQG